jgi:hypothetical protein
MVGSSVKRGGETQGLLAAATLLLTVSTAAADMPARPWPPILGPREAFSPELSATIERVWLEPTLRRTVNGPVAHVPPRVYLAFVDTPDVTAAAARFRKLASYEVQVLGDERYRGDDGDGARGITQVLRREGQQRVILSQGEHTSRFLGTISGSALSVLDLEQRVDSVEPVLTAYVHIDDRVAAALARALIPSFGFLADRKLAEGLRITAVVAEWAIDPSGGFCEWLAAEPIPAARRARVMAALPACARGVAQSGDARR